MMDIWVLGCHGHHVQREHAEDDDGDGYNEKADQQPVPPWNRRRSVEKNVDADE